MTSLLPAWRRCYEASVSLGIQGRQNRAWGLTGIRRWPSSIRASSLVALAQCVGVASVDHGSVLPGVLLTAVSTEAASRL